MGWKILEGCLTKFGGAEDSGTVHEVALWGFREVFLRTRATELNGAKKSRNHVRAFAWLLSRFECTHMRKDRHPLVRYFVQTRVTRGAYWLGR